MSNVLQQFRRGSSGNLTITFALALIPIMAAAGAAVEYSRGTAFRSLRR